MSLSLLQTPKKVLIVDDIAPVRAILKQAMTDLGYDVVGEAAHGYEAIEQTHRLKPDLITMDVIMPLMGGIEATAKIKEFYPEIKIIAISSIQSQDIQFLMLTSGASAYLQKPFALQELQSALSDDVSTLDQFDIAV